jgi:CheY-like chemotaxis protein
LSVSLCDVTYKPKNDGHRRKTAPLNYVHLVVRDTGHGMSTKVIKKIFDPYFTTKGYGKGTGLGLAVVHGILQSHKAKIKVTSKPGQGTIFSIYFPVAGTAAIATGKKKNKWAAKPDANKASILFADDEQAIRDLFQTYLEKYGYQLTTCKNGEEAWRKFATEPAKWDLLVTDQNMPRLTGTELIQKIRKIRPDIPIILATGYSENITTEEFVKLNISAMLRKPTPMDKMVEYIQKTLKRPRR